MDLKVITTRAVRKVMKMSEKHNFNYNDCLILIDHDEKFF